VEEHATAPPKMLAEFHRRNSIWIESHIME
jgi:hypothetical protein